MSQGTRPLSVFVDSSAWYAAADAGDAHHDRARQVLGGGHRLVTTDHVLVEAWTLVRWRLGRPAAERFWGALRGGATVIESVGPADLEAAWSIAEAFPDQDFSLVDRTSFATMLRLGVHTAAAFDDDFAVFRFGPARARSFTVLR